MSGPAVVPDLGGRAEHFGLAGEGGAELAQHAERAGIRRADVADEAGGGNGGPGPVAQRAAGLGGIALAPEGAVEAIGEFRIGPRVGVKNAGAPGKAGRASTPSFTTRSYGAMGNVLYDIDLKAPVVPYVGVGAGVQWANIRGMGANETSKAAGAGQAIVGLALPLDQNLSITAEARAITLMGDAKFHGTSIKNPVNLSGLVGVRYAFGAPPVAAPAPAPAPAPVVKAEEARTYLVFFDWDKADLTARARQIIADAAGASSRLAVTRIEVAGHADKSGTATYNQGLSMKRAQAVAGELVRLGVKKDAIAVSAFGDTKPLVPTADGVREPQNRRVEIVLK